MKIEGAAFHWQKYLLRVDIDNKNSGGCNHFITLFSRWDIRETPLYLIYWRLIRWNHYTLLWDYYLKITRMFLVIKGFVLKEMKRTGNDQYHINLFRSWDIQTFFNLILGLVTTLCDSWYLTESAAVW